MMMQGIHLTGDLFDCNCSAGLLTDLEALSRLCRDTTVDSGLTIVDEKYHVFPQWQGQPGGITGAVLLAESHLAIHTWPERRGVTLDVYVCNFTADNEAKARQLFDTLMLAFRPRSQVVNRIVRGDLAAGADAVAASAASAAGAGTDKPERDQLIFDWLNAHAGYGYTARQQIAVKDTPAFHLYSEEFFRMCQGLLNPGGLMTLHLGSPVYQPATVKIIRIAREHLGTIHKGALDDPRLEIRIGDGFEFVRACTEKFDLVVLDLTDPDTPAFHLYSEEFFRMCRGLLNPGGLMTLHLGSPVYQPATVKKNAAALRKVFKHVSPLTVFIPLYGSLWCLGVASDSVNPRALATEAVAQRLRERRINGLRLYNAEMHGALFALPTFVRELTDPAAPVVPAKRAA